ncbi:helix-turn-helix domain-containing protein [Viridibacillus sp. FSL H8-0123]|uniref:helix-turn-helix domain-containing protein n=1 Tax=Viridibacillus sp. FSL H8-0123 TaxID=1928922 RepID=UPI00096F6BC4|nr:helix-turn-helix domain-containing protein [Viridibacillus sp. FSL H8-0123]OMC80921.1 hypothetical protein BK130_16495 [Viridibacillus sp. FSL H8-0123]
MTITDEKKKAQVLPFKVAKGFAALPKSVLYMYSGHPEVKPATLSVYALLLDYHDEKLGYAFPTQDQIADALFISRSTVSAAITTLKRLELINTHENPRFGNLVYTFIRPIELLQTFEEKFPEAKTYREEKEAARKRDIEGRHKRQEEFRARVAQDRERCEIQ